MNARVPVVVSVAALAFGAAACADSKAPEPTAPRPASGNAVERYFPLEEGKLYQYVTRENDDSGMLVARVHRTDGAHGELRMSNATRRFVFAQDGVAYDGGAFILRAPLDVGASWPGEHGGTTRITSVDASVTVAAGAYASCLVTVEEGGRPQGSRYATTYCPGVGMVLLEVTVPSGAARAELKSYGFPAKIE